MPLIKTPHQIQSIKDSGKYLNELLLLVASKSQAGVALIELEFIAEHFLKSKNLKGAFKHYQGFPANLCLSVNDCLVHGIPDDTLLKNGDLLKIDCGINYHGGISDSAITLLVGGELTNPLGHQLLCATKDSLDNGLQEIGPGISALAYGRKIEQTIHEAGFSIIHKLTGHGVGTMVHEDPHVYNYPHPDMKKIMWKPGMVVALEPITAVSSTEFVTRRGNTWNLYCKNGDLGAHWEYTIVITEHGYEVLSGITENLGF